MLRGIIVEDEPAEAAELQKILNKLQPELSCLIFQDGTAALEYIKTHKELIHIFFIDRRLPEMDGFMLASGIRDMKRYVLTPVVFVTGYEMGKLSAFEEYHCYSYIVKPISEESVKASIGILLETLGRRARQKKLKRIVPLTIEGDIKLVEAESILGLETAGRGCYVYVGQNRYRILRQTLDKTVKEIGDPYCLRCHKSFALNLRNVMDIKKARRNIWIPVFSQETEFQCEISKTHYQEVMNCYKKYLSGKE